MCYPALGLFDNDLHMHIIYIILDYKYNVLSTYGIYYIMAISFVFFVLPHTATSCTIDN